jgi:hypothetical protein
MAGTVSNPGAATPKAAKPSPTASGSGVSQRHSLGSSRFSASREKFERASTSQPALTK